MIFRVYIDSLHSNGTCFIVLLFFFNDDTFFLRLSVDDDRLRMPASDFVSFVVL